MQGCWGETSPELILSSTVLDEFNRERGRAHVLVTKEMRPWTYHAAYPLAPDQQYIYIY